jgi:pimeloyl-ACP methyl ester carboxylesterase
MLGAFVDRPRAVVVALHGGGASKEYFDTPVDPALSLLRLGAALGFTVVAVDRPGYGPDSAGDPVDAGARTDLLFGTLDALFADRPVGAGPLLLAHSMGCVSALRMAADDERGGHLLGIELSGTGRTHHPMAAAITGGGTRRVGGPSLGRLIWGPDDLYPPGTREAQRSVTGSAREGDDARGWPTELPALAARVRVPVRYTLAEHESWWLPGAEGLQDVAALFTAAPVVETAIEPNAGHNISLGRTARAYHLRVFAFAEQCLARRGR